MQPAKIIEENFKDIDPKILLDPDHYQDVENMVISIDSAETADYSKEYAFLLADKLSRIGDKIDPGLFEKYLKLLKVLRLGSLLAVNDTEKEKFFKESILDVFRLDFVNVKDKVDFVFRSYYGSREIIQNLRNIFLTGIENNAEILGSEDIIVTISGSEKKLKPTLRNWLIDYNSTQHVNPEIKKRGGYEQVSYMTSSPNVRTLKKQNRELLLKIIQFYDWLKFDPLIYNFRLPNQPEWEERFVNIQSPQSLIPDEFIDKINQSRQEVSKYTNQQNLVLPKDFKLPDLPKVAAQEPKAPLRLIPSEADKSLESTSPIPSPILGEGKEEQANPLSLTKEKTITPPASPYAKGREAGQGKGEGQGGGIRGEGIKTVTPPTPSLEKRGEEGQGEGIEQKGVKGAKGQMGERGVKGEKGMIGGIPTLRSGQVGGMEGDELAMGKGLKMWNQDVKQKQSITPTPPVPLMQRGEVKPPVAPKPKINIDQKLEELKKKAQKNKNT